MTAVREQLGRGGGLPYKNDGGCSSYLSGVLSIGTVYKMTAGKVIAVPFRVLSKKIKKTMCAC